MIRKIVGTLVAALLMFGVGPAMAVDGPRQGLTDYGKQSIEELATCLRTADSLSVYYLIDASTSLKSSDPKNLRAGIISQDIHRWADIAGLQPKLKVQVAGALFNSDAYTMSNWQSLDKQNADQVSRQFTSQINNNHLGNYTNWLAGLTSAFNALESQQTGCKAVIWFTDGGLWSPNGERKASIQDVAALCGPAKSGDVTRENSATGLIAKMRSAGIHLFGILLHVGVDSEENEAYYRSLMLPIIEEKGDLPVAQGLPSGTLTCGENQTGEARTYATGAFVEATSAADIAYEFMRIPNAVSGATEVGEFACSNKKGPFFLDPGIDSVEIATDATSWKVLDAKGSVFASSSDGASSQGATGRIKVPSVDKAEQWTFIPQNGAGRCDLYVFPELYLDLHSKSLVSGVEGSITGQFVKSLTSGAKADLSVYKKVDFKASINQHTYPAKLDSKTGSFSIDNFKSSSTDTQAVVRASLELETQHYKLAHIDFEQVERIYPAQVLPTIGKIKFIGGIKGSKGVAQATLEILPPAQPGLASSVCFTKFQVIADRQDESSGRATDRSKSWAWSTQGLDSKECVDLLMGTTQAQKITFKVTNPKQANADIEALFEYEISSGDLNGLQDSQTAAFKSESNTSGPLFLLWLVLAVAVGLAVPFGVLTLLNHANAKLVVGSNVQRAEFKVYFDPATRRIMHAAPNGFVPVEDLALKFIDVFQISKKGVTNYSDPASANGMSELLPPGFSLSLRAKAAKWPLNGPQFEIEANRPLTLVKDSSVAKPGDLNGHISTGKISNLAYVQFDAAAIAAAKQRKSAVEGVLVLHLQQTPQRLLEDYELRIDNVMTDGIFSETIAQAIEDFSPDANFETSSSPLSSISHDEGTIFSLDPKQGFNLGPAGQTPNTGSSNSDSDPFNLDGY